MSIWEVCEIIRVTLQEKEVSAGFLNWTYRGIYRYEAQKVAPSGPETIFSSDDFVYELVLKEGTEKWVEEEAKDTKAYNQVVAHLTSKGWEPVAIHPGGRIATMKRRIGGAVAVSATSSTDLLQQLATLRDAGILTEQEFQTKKAEILKRM